MGNIGQKKTKHFRTFTVINSNVAVIILIFCIGPSRLPIVGNTFLMKKLSKKLGGQYLALLKLSKDYKTNILGLKLGSDQYVVVFGRKLVNEIFVRDEFQGRPDGFFIRLRTMGTKKGKLENESNLQS